MINAVNKSQTQGKIMTLPTLTELTWTKFISDPDNFELIADQCYRQHTRSKEFDFCIIKNISVDSEYFLKLKTYEKNPFNRYVGQFRRDYNKQFVDTYTDTLLASEPDYTDDHITQLKKDLNLDEIYCLQQTQLPGTLVGQHTDLNRGLSNILVDKGIDQNVKLKHIRKYIVYLDNWAHGQVFMVGRHAHTNWQKGDVMSFEWYMPHSTVNAGLKPRPILFIAGVEFD